nr:probable C-mannosyltransferase DPY19L3 isoform X2 [Paramormyrops kingsleyae]
MPQAQRTIRCGGMSTLRQRKDVKRKDLGQERQIPDSREDHAKRTQTSFQTWWTGIWVVFGAVLGVSLGLLNCTYMATLHENDLWFSNIKEVEREISFRTECGLYYSYYKQMIQASSIEQGLLELIYDNKTESRRTINVLQRMNIYQEVFLSILYRLLPVQGVTLLAQGFASSLSRGTPRWKRARTGGRYRQCLIA